MPPFSSASALAAALKKREVSAVEAVRHYLGVIDAKNSELNAIIWRRDEELLKEAEVVDAELKRGGTLPPFLGVPIPIKDLTETLGHPTTHGSRVAKDKIGRFDTNAVRKIREAGFLILGRSNSPEFGTLPVTENALYGATRSPWDPKRTPGGSSGGAAAAVAAGMAPIAHASDGGGSIRIPASCCGLVGLKASRGRIPKGPIISDVMLGLPTDGVVSVTVEDSAAMLDAMAFRDLDAWYGVPEPDEAFLSASRRAPKRLKIGFTTKGPVAAPLDPEVVNAVDKTAKKLSDLGHDVYEVTKPWPVDGEQLARDFITIWSTGSAYLDFADMTQLEPLNAGLKKMCERLSVSDYIQAVMRMQIFSRRVVERWSKDHEFDVLLTPTMAIEPPPIGWVFATGETDPSKILLRCTDMVPFTGWCNVTGQPAISLPTYVSSTGLPLGVQLVGAPFDEATLLQLSAQLESELRWEQHLPR